MSRSHETRIEIDAPIEEVWKAITEADGLSRWFAPRNEVKPGVGGHVLGDWGPGLEWKTVIEVWEPLKHLRLSEMRDRIFTTPPDESLKMEACRLVQDYYLETANGKTVLRLVHSGFGSSDAWDLEYEGTRQGWATCFERMKYGLERYPGMRVHNLIIPWQCHGVTPEESLSRVKAAVGQPLEMRFLDKGEFGGIASNEPGKFFSVSSQKTSAGSTVYIQCLLFNRTDADAAEFEEGWRAKLGRLFPR
ncbi:MAG: SRPBCC domain-containing protein [Bryobacterales bacterium]|nr:SRPBCC domain-containing protein [Bryobacterales bacterium]